MSEIVQSVIARNAYMTLATADEHGTPWASPVWYATGDCREFVWVSAPSARHSRNLSARPELAIGIFDSQQRPYTSEGVYISARAEQVPDHELDRCLAIFCDGSQRHGLPTGVARMSSLPLGFGSITRTRSSITCSPRPTSGSQSRFDRTGQSRRMAVKRMDNVGIVVDDLEETIGFFRELGLELEGQGVVDGEWAGRVTGLGDQRVEIAMMRTPDGHSRLELSRFLAPPVIADHRNAPVNALGYLRVMFAVDDLDETLARLREHGAQLVDEVVQFQDAYRLCYIRGPGGLLVGLAEELG